MSVLPLSLFLRVEGGASQCGFLGRGHSLSGKIRGRVTLWSGLGAKLQNQVLRGIAISPLGRAHNYEVV